MLYNDLMQKPGKRINPKVYYGLDENKVEYGYDDIVSAKPFFNAKLVGTVMQGLELELKKELPDEPIYFENEVSYGNSSAKETFGPFYLKEKPSYNADSKTYTHSLYDNMLKAMVDYKPITIDYPTTIDDFFLQLCKECNFITSIKHLPNGDKIISNDIYSDIGFTYRDVYEDIGQATATLFAINGNEVIKVELSSDNEIVIDDDILKNKNINIGEHFGPINSIILSRSGDSDFIYKRDESLTEWNEFKISDNQLMNNNNRSEFLDELYENLHGIEYDIFDLELVGYGGFKPLQRIKIVTGDNTYYSYVFNNEQKYTQGFEECIYTELPEETETDYKASDTTDRRINQAYLIVDKQNQQIESVVSQVDGQNEKISQVTQTVSELNQKIQNISDITISDSTLIGYLELNGINESEPINITIRPLGEDISYNYPHINLFPNDNLFLKTRKLRFHNKTTNEDIDYILPDDLLYYDSNNYDEFRLDYDTQTCEVRKKVEYDADGNKYLLDNVKVNNYDYPTIRLTDGDYEISLLGYNNAYLSVRLMASNIYTSQFATRVELKSSISQTEDKITTEVSQVEDLVNEEVGNLNSRITQTANNITIEVNKKISNDDGGVELASLIRQTAEEIYLKANNFGWESTNSSMTTDGTLTAHNANIVGGKIELTDGAQIVGDDGLLSTMHFRSAGQYSTYSTVGFQAQASNESVSKTCIPIDIYIPENFIVTNAYFVFNHVCPGWSYVENGVLQTTVGYIRNAKLYKTLPGRYYNYDFITTHCYANDNDIQEIPNAFGVSAYTPPYRSINDVSIVQTIELKDYLTTSGRHSFLIQSSDSIPSFSTYQDAMRGTAERTGAGYIDAVITGYKKY